MKYKRVVVSKFGGPKNLHLIEEEIPEPRGHEVRVKILTAGVSLADILMREGIHPETLFRQTPFTLGWDIVGTVDKIGEKLSATSTWQIGDIVSALPIVGGYAQYLCVPSTSSYQFLLEWTPPKQLAYTEITLLHIKCCIVVPT